MNPHEFVFKHLAKDKNLDDKTKKAFDFYGQRNEEKDTTIIVGQLTVDDLLKNDGI